MPINILALATADFLPFLARLVAVVAVCTFLIVLKARLSSRSKDRDMARRIKLNQEMHMAAIDATRRMACVIEEKTRTTLSKEDWIKIHRSTIGLTHSSASVDDLSSFDPEGPRGPSVSLNFEG